MTARSAASALALKLGTCLPGGSRIGRAGSETMVELIEIEIDEVAGGRGDIRPF